jgi:ABC-type transporter Mla subunit MlaD
MVADTKLDTENFVEVEQTIHELLEGLQQLKQEVEGYDRAKNTLEDVGTRVAELASRLSGLAENTHSIIDAIRRIGTPEILAQIKVLQSAQSDVAQAVRKSAENLASITESQSRFSEKFDSTGETIQHLLATNQTQLERRLDVLQTTFGRRLRTLTLVFALGSICIIGAVLTGIPAIHKFLGW